LACLHGRNSAGDIISFGLILNRPLKWVGLARARRVRCLCRRGRLGQYLSDRRGTITIAAPLSDSTDRRRVIKTLARVSGDSVLTARSLFVSYQESAEFVASPRIKDNQTRLQLFALAYNLGNFLRRLALPKPVRHWSLTTLREKLIKIGAKVTRHSKYVTFQLAEVAVTRNLFAAILDRIARLALPPPVVVGRMPA
jgi:hypothetical protein